MTRILGQRTSGAPGQPRSRKHLMVPGQPRPPQRTTNITTVQRWVLASLAFVTLEHMAGGLVLAAYFTEGQRVGARIGLLAVATGFATTAVLAVLLIHQKRPASPWLLIALFPAAVGAHVCFIR